MSDSTAHLRTAVALVATSLALTSIVDAPSDTRSWRPSQAEWVQTAVLADLVEQVRSGRVDPYLTGKPLCVGFWSTTRVLTSGGQRDPSSVALAQLKAMEPLVRPASACSYSREGLVESATGRRAVLLAAGQPKWVDDEFARVDGAWYVGSLYAQGSEYTVSLSDGRWAVDTATFTWIS